MPLGLDSARHLFDKVQRDRIAVEAHVSSDTLFNFVVTAHSLGDWVENDPLMDSAAKAAAKQLVATNPWLRACRDLANGSKHFTIDRYEPFLQHSDVAAGYGQGRFGQGSYGGGELQITISWDDTRHEALALVAHVADAWHQFFDAHGEGGGEPAA